MTEIQKDKSLSELVAAAEASEAEAYVQMANNGGYVGVGESVPLQQNWRLPVAGEPEKLQGRLTNDRLTEIHLGTFEDDDSPFVFIENLSGSEFAVTLTPEQEADNRRRVLAVSLGGRLDQLTLRPATPGKTPGMSALLPLARHCSSIWIRATQTDLPVRYRIHIFRARAES